MIHAHLLPSVDFLLPFCLHNNPFHTETTTSVHTPMSCRASVVKTLCSHPLLEGSYLELLNVQETCSNCLVNLCGNTVQSTHVFTSTLIHNCSKGFIKDRNSLKLTLRQLVVSQTDRPTLSHCSKSLSSNGQTGSHTNYFPCHLSQSRCVWNILMTVTQSTLQTGFLFNNVEAN